ncbi:archaemetzincin [Hyperthermus butylicus]|uniref:Archaemetzincin n=1 Tax=Hyperthermus butylicus (strain DSM 5456 / JCM 9403 / PLM1-5) TaxID=415426 RepID=A2BKG5_HYPBU|nr:archaemetzincin [Hyperthermus butylicus]ABM80476.1 putative Zn-dependent protease [Hyperthermus butylicus DSM 5456]
MVVIHIAGTHVERDDLVFLSARLREAYSNAHVNIVEQELEPPPSAYDPVRRQYLSDAILELAAILHEKLRGDALLVVAGFDAYTPGLNFVFGQALLGRGVAVVYTARLHPEFYGEPPNEALYRRRLLKEALHELGHALGLEHCATPGCVMNFSNSIWGVDKKKPMYCRRCTVKLAARGVRVSPAYILGA